MMRDMFLTVAFLFSFLVQVGEAAPASTPEVEIGWEYKAFPGTVELYEVSPKYRYSVSKTGVTNSLERIPSTGKKIAPKLHVRPGESRTFVLVVRNSSPNRWFFFASPHLMDPPEASQGHHFECLCIHHVFEVPPQAFWYRIVRLNLSKDYKAARSKLVHTIIGVPESEALTTYRKQLFLQPKKGRT